MTARQKLEDLTNAWYGMGVFGAICAILQNGFGIFTLIWTALVTCFGFFITWFIGRRLLAKSSLTRAILIIGSALVTVLSSIGTVRGAWVFLHDWSWTILMQLVLSAASVYMNGRSFRVLRDESVRAYFA